MLWETAAFNEIAKVGCAELLASAGRGPAAGRLFPTESDSVSRALPEGHVQESAVPREWLRSPLPFFLLRPCTPCGSG